MSYYTDLDEDRGMEEMAIRDMREWERERKAKRAYEDSRVKREVERQLKSYGITKPVKSRVFNNGKEVKSSSSIRGAKQSVTCASFGCSVEFEARVSDIKRGWGKFCSKRCKAITQERKKCSN